MAEPITIGVDHGYAAMKTAHCSFPSGLAEYEHEPYTQKNVLCYDGKYYVVGSGRQPLQKDKTADENYYLLTLAAIAKEIAYRNAPTTTPVILAAGLPLTSFGREKKHSGHICCARASRSLFRMKEFRMKLLCRM